MKHFILVLVSLLILWEGHAQNTAVQPQEQLFTKGIGQPTFIHTIDWDWIMEVEADINVVRECLMRNEFQCAQDMILYYIELNPREDRYCYFMEELYEFIFYSEQDLDRHTVALLYECYWSLDCHCDTFLYPEDR